MKPLTCASARRRLQAFHDGELSVADQIAVASHLEWCDECSEAFEELQTVGTVLRMALPGRTALEGDAHVTFPAAVVNRMKAERTVSWSVRLQLMFEDAHLVYAGGAAAVAAVVCVVVMLGMMRFVNDTPRPDSLAALIHLLTPGSNQNPVAPRPDVLMPKSLDEAFVTGSGLDAWSVGGSDDAAFMLAAVVTREGRVENLELLRQTGEEVAATESQAVADLMDAVSRARFEPASVEGLPVAVNMVWLVAHTTVRGTAEVAKPATTPAKTPAKRRRIAATLTAPVYPIARHA